MPDMYEKLGDLLNEALESGSIKQEKSASAEKIQDRDTSNSDESNIQNCDKSGLFYYQNSTFPGKKRKIILKVPQNNKKLQAEIINMYKYTKIMHITPEIQKALTTLDIAYPCTWNDIKHRYKTLLKENHPDTQNTTQNSKCVLNNRQLTIDEIRYNYKILENFFKK